MRRLTPISVQTYSGYKADESPRAFFRSGSRHEILRVLATSLDAEVGQEGRFVRRFQVLTASGEQQTLLQDVERGDWFIVE
jgi:hypothetical protein